ncbi:MAG: putative RDD family membrane protein YckC [Zhongshania sp.]|jgi:uncharacterized RDD family membrane protein YckC|nr:RDD family protein [Zhongshania sp.]
MPKKSKTTNPLPKKDATTKPVSDNQIIANEGPPGVFRRIAVIVYDAFLLFAVLFVATLIPAYFISPESFIANPANNSVVHELDIPLQGWIYRAYLVTLIIIFYGWFWRKNGQTLGMQAWRIKLESQDGGKPSWGQCTIRVLVAGVSLLAGGLGYWWIWIDRDSLSWHDRASKTVLRSIPKDKKKA